MQSSCTKLPSSLLLLHDSSLELLPLARIARCMTNDALYARCVNSGRVLEGKSLLHEILQSTGRRGRTVYPHPVRVHSCSCSTGSPTIQIEAVPGLCALWTRARYNLWRLLVRKQECLKKKKGGGSCVAFFCSFDHIRDDGSMAYPVL